MAADQVVRRTVVVCSNLATTHGVGMVQQVALLARQGIEVIGIGHGLPDSPAAPHYDRAYDNVAIEATRPATAFKAARRIREICVEHQPAVIWFHTSLAAAVGRLATLTLPRRSRPTIAYMAYAFHFRSPSSGLAGLGLRGAEWTLSLVTDHLQTVNLADYERARRMPRRNSANTELTRGIGFDRISAEAALNQRETTRSELGVESTTPLVVVRGSLESHKRVDDAIRSFAALGHGTLMIVGSGTDESRVRALADAHPHADIRFVEADLDDLRYLAAADLLLHPSTQEGLPHTILQAQAMGIPVVGARVRGTTDLLNRGAGVLCTPGNVRGYTTAMRAIIEDPDHRSAIVTAGRERAAQHDQESAVTAALTIALLLD